MNSISKNFQVLTNRPSFMADAEEHDKWKAKQFFMFHDPLSLMSPKATKLIRLYCGWFDISDYQIFRHMVEYRIPLKHIPKQYHPALLIPTLPTYSYFEATSNFVWELMTQRLTFVSRHPSYIKVLIENWCGYDEDFLNDKILTRMISEYKDPRHIHYTLKYLLNERVFWLTDCQQKRYQLSTVLEYLQQQTKKYQLTPIKSQFQLTLGLNQLTISTYGKPCIIRNREFFKATRHIEIPNLFYKLNR